MAGKSNPSLYNERTTIGSSDDLDEYGVWVKTEPQDLSSSLPEIEELPEFDTDFNEETALPDIDTPDSGASMDDDFDLPDFNEEELSGAVSLNSSNLEFEEIPENSELPEGLAPVSIDGDGFTEVSMNDFIDRSNIKSPESIDFGNLDSSVSDVETLDAVEDNAPRPSSGNSHSQGIDLSTQLLQKIADELSSIKKEISSLKTELSVVRGEIKAPEAADSKGFFDEEDDEKIALTGDELDNILNTANFTEETGSGEGIESDISLDSEERFLDESGAAGEKDGAQSVIGFEEDISELDGVINNEEGLKISSAEDFDIALDISSEFQDDSSELNILREEGAFPITEAPEDTNYLEEDILSSEGETFSDEIDLSGAVIDEPDLSSQITENPVTEPVIDNISIDIEMEDAAQGSISGSDDFVFETEETMEIPFSELPEIDEALSPIDSAEEDFISQTDEEVDFSETVPKGLFEQKAVPPDLHDGIPNNLKLELKTVLSYMDQLLESLPEDKIEEFAKSEYFDTYKKLFEELGLV